MSSSLLAVLSQLAHLPHEPLDVTSVIGRICEVTSQVLRFESVRVRLYDKASDELRHVVGTGLPLSPVPAIKSAEFEKYLGDKTLAVIDDVQEIPTAPLWELARKYDVRTVVLVAMRKRPLVPVGNASLMGVLVLNQTGRCRVLTEDERVFLDGLASLSLCAIEAAQARESLRRSEASFRTLVEALPDAVAVAKPAEGIHYANPAAARLLGFADPQGLLGRRLYDFVDPQDLPELFELGEALGPSDKIPRRQTRLVGCDGRGLVADVVSVSLSFGGEPCVASIATDVSERLRLEAQVSSSDRLAAVGTLAAGVAHEINNPLAFIVANLERVVARARLGQFETVARLAGEALDGVHRIRKIVRDLRVFSRDEPEQREAVDIHAVIDSALTLAAPSLRLRGTLHREFWPYDIFVSGSEARIGQVFLNLLLNAAQALPDRELGVPPGADSPSKSAHVTVRTSVRGGDAVIEVIDTGGGISEEHLRRIFDPFFSTKPVGVGTGLGLSISHGIVTSLGGTIAAESSLGVGTTMRVTLPVVAGVLDAPLSPPKPSPRRLRVLVLDDEPQVGTAIVHMLEDEHDAFAATNPQTVLERALLGERWDVIICDVQMPGMSGVELYRRLEAIDPALSRRMVFISGGTFQGKNRDFLRQCDNPCVDKPIDWPELNKALSHVGKR